MSLSLTPITLREANAFVEQHHRHHGPSRGCILCVVLATEGEVRGGGLMVKAIAQRIGVAPQTLHNLVSGMTREPCYSIGVKLLELRDRVRP